MSQRDHSSSRDHSLRWRGYLAPSSNQPVCTCTPQSDAACVGKVCVAGGCRVTTQWVSCCVQYRYVQNPRMEKSDFWWKLNFSPLTRGWKKPKAICFWLFLIITLPPSGFWIYHTSSSGFPLMNPEGGSVIIKNMNPEGGSVIDSSEGGSVIIPLSKIWRIHTYTHIYIYVLKCGVIWGSRVLCHNTIVQKLGQNHWSRTNLLPLSH